MVLCTRSARARWGAGIESLTIAEHEVPPLHRGEALVRLNAATINYRDLLILRGLVPGVKQDGYIPLSDGAGEVVEVGPDVRRVKPGDRVSPLFAQGWLDGPRPTMTMLGGPVDGVARSYAAFDADSLCLIPDELTDLEAAALPCAGLTAWSALFGPRPLEAGEWLLVQGTGGVSVAALQFAKAAGAHVVVTSSSDAKLRRARALGADITINYWSNPDWASAARAALGDPRISIVVDVVGATEVAQCEAVLAEGGAISAVGRLTGPTSTSEATKRPIHRITVGNRNQHEAMLNFCAEHHIRPIIDSVFDLARLGDGLRRMEAGSFFGKIGINLL